MSVLALLGCRMPMFFLPSTVPRDLCAGRRRFRLSRIPRAAAVYAQSAARELASSLRHSRLDLAMWAFEVESLDERTTVVVPFRASGSPRLGGPVEGEGPRAIAEPRLERAGFPAGARSFRRCGRPDGQSAQPLPWRAPSTRPRAGFHALAAAKPARGASRCRAVRALCPDQGTASGPRTSGVVAPDRG